MSGPYTGPTKFFLLAKDILASVVAGCDSQFGRTVVTPGQIAWDNCDCGAVYMVVEQIFGTDDTINQKVAVDLAAGCGAPWVGASFIMQVMECAPKPEASTGVPSLQSEEDSAAIVQRDMMQSRMAVEEFLCAAYTSGYVMHYIVDTSIVQGPSGGCVGSETRFRVALRWNP